MNSKTVTCYVQQNRWLRRFVTGDQSLVSEQPNLIGRQLAIVALSANNWPIIKKLHHTLHLHAAIDAAAPGSVHTVECALSAARDNCHSSGRQAKRPILFQRDPD